MEQHYKATLSVHCHCWYLSGYDLGCCQDIKLPTINQIYVESVRLQRRQMAHGGDCQLVGVDIVTFGVKYLLLPSPFTLTLTFMTDLGHQAGWLNWPDCLFVVVLSPSKI